MSPVEVPVEDTCSVGLKQFFAVAHVLPHVLHASQGGVG